jgi:hypothetical protein
MTIARNRKPAVIWVLVRGQLPAARGTRHADIRTHTVYDDNRQDLGDIFVAARDFQVWSAYWDPVLGWNGWWQVGEIESPGVPAGVLVTAVSRSKDKLDIFVTETSGEIKTAA